MPEILAVLGPTNTGKTHHAIERMLRHRSGIIGLPLRLLAREVFDRIVARRGSGAAALITGEEKIIPETARFMVCTVEAMPQDRRCEFLAVDEIQLCADPERGHVFTDRLLHARGLAETLFLGSHSMEQRIRQLVPEAKFAGRQRFSALTYTPRTRLDRLPPRSAVVAFSADEVYAIAELVRHRKGGAAVVLGALSPRTRNAQVALFQGGEVDTIVATDAIGMGLNLDVDHVSFAALSKFDGHVRRELEVEEIGQIAGRAGRHRSPGTFGVSGSVEEISPRAVRAVEEQRFPPVESLRWRNAKLDFTSIAALLASLNQASDQTNLIRPREGTDHRALQILAEIPDVRDAASSPECVRVLWDACRIPDYPKISPGHHAGIAEEAFRYRLQRPGTLPEDWVAKNLARVDNTAGDIVDLSARLAHARTWQYIANQSAWHEDPEYWRDRTRAIEDKLSDALHARLVARFIDRRAIILAKSHNRREAPMISLKDDMTVLVDGQPVGFLEGCRFRPIESGERPVSDPERAARIAAIRPAIARRATALSTAPDSEFAVGDDATVMWKNAPLARLFRGPEAMQPDFRLMIEETAAAEDVERIRMRVRAWLESQIRTAFEPLIALKENTEISGVGRGIAYRLVEGFGILERRTARADIADLSQDDRRPLRKHGVRFGFRYVFLPALLKPLPTRWRLLLWGIGDGGTDLQPPPPGLVNIPAEDSSRRGYYPMSGFHHCGKRAVRIDILERLEDLVREADHGEGFESNRDMLSITGCTPDEFRDVMVGLGYEAERRERPTAEAAPETPKPDKTEDETPQSARALLPHSDAGPSVVYFFRKLKRKKPLRRNRTKAGRTRLQSSQPDRNSTKNDHPRKFSPARAKKPIDPNSPFAVLAKLGTSVESK